MSAAYATYMASSSNVRYQILAGVIEERGIERLLHGNGAACGIASLVARFCGWIICASSDSRRRFHTRSLLSSLRVRLRRRQRRNMRSITDGKPANSSNRITLLMGLSGTLLSANLVEIHMRSDINVNSFTNRASLSHQVQQSRTLYSNTGKCKPLYNVILFGRHRYLSPLTANMYTLSVAIE